MNVKPNRPRRKPRPLCQLGERLPELRQLRDRLARQTIVTDDLPSDYLRALFGLPNDRPIWSRADALCRENH